MRIDPGAKIKHVFLKMDAAGSGAAADFSLAFSNNPNDGTQASFIALTNSVIQLAGPADNRLFGAALDVSGALPSSGNGFFELTFANSFTLDHRNIPLWQVLVQLGCTQFTSNPGGMFDLMLKTTSTWPNAVTNMALEVVYVRD